jgi:shikimate 5-dehydrogenase
MAQLAIKLAPMFGTTFITCRDKDKENALCEKYSLQSGQISKVYDLVINCTPIGCNDTDIFTETGIKHPRMIIDFPYCEYKASLNLAGYESNHYVDGIQLWKWQAMPQLAVFLHNIKGED